MQLLVVERRHRNGGIAFPIELDAHEPGLAADLAVLNILLDRAAARIDQQLARLPAVWAGDANVQFVAARSAAFVQFPRYSRSLVHQCIV